ncbi:MAG: dihydroorotate dehydrogenase B (NAD(+)), catalytic subunit [Phycisphaeraceae bacterium]|nr:MAG: dihydroorotate dehydrogenase B (NAD(+)), catalytic subunit [Phycisphaeraceae bacterium]
MGTPDPILKTTLAGIDLAAPVLTAAGTAGTTDEIGEILDLSQIGAVVTKSITPEPREGNPPPRVVPLDVGMLNAIGLAGPGIDAFAEMISDRPPGKCPLIGSVAAFDIEGYARVARTMGELDALAAIEINVSCPNVHGGTEFGADPVALAEVLNAAREVAGGKPVFVKLSPITVGTPHSIADLARVAINAGVQAITLCNTVPGMAIDVRTRAPVLTNVTGGYSGPAVRPIVLKLVHDTYRAAARDASVPIIAAGGVAGWAHAAEYILAGATAVQIGAGSLADPRTPARVARGLGKWAHAQGVSSIGELTGAIRLPS